MLGPGRGKYHALASHNPRPLQILNVTEIRSGECGKLGGVTVDIEDAPKPALLAEWLILH